MATAVQCNIDRKGRALRGVSSAILLFGAVAGWWLGWLAWTSVVLGACGLFAGFEALRGWCALRALGFKTKY